MDHGIRRDVDGKIIGYRSTFFIRNFNISARQLQNWNDLKLVIPERQGFHRSYSPDQAMFLGILAALMKKKVTLIAIRKWSRTIVGVDRLIGSQALTWATREGRPPQGPIWMWTPENAFLMFNLYEEAAEYAANHCNYAVWIINIKEIAQTLRQVPRLEHGVPPELLTGEMAKV